MGEPQKTQEPEVDAAPADETPVLPNLDELPED
jgi:hypothetical protein